MVPAPEPVATDSNALAAVPANSGGGSDQALPRPVRALAPGFRFHPTDEELVIYYLKRKICGRAFLYDAITSVDIYKTEPWHLPDKSQIKTRDQEWYFFSALDRKYTNGARMNRATQEGYWKATGNDRAVKHGGEVVGLKKTLVFHQGRAPDGKRTNWVMHEYRLVEAELLKCGPGRDPYVLCRVFHKSNMGPPIGHRYAPFVEQEWDDTSSFLPGADTAEESEGNEPLKALPSTEEVHSALPIKTQCLLDVCKNERIESDEFGVAAPNANTAPDGPPLLRYKRRKSIDLNLKASDGTEPSNKLQPPPPLGPCSSSATSAATNGSNPTSRLSALVEYSLMESISLKESAPNPRPGFDSSILNNSVPPEYINFINSLQEEVYKVSMDRETLRLEMFSVRAMMSILQSRLDNLTKENEELKKKLQVGGGKQ